MARIARLFLLIAIAGTSFLPRADAAPLAEGWWAVAKIDFRVKSVTGTFLSFMGPLPTWEMCNPIVEEIREGFRKDQPQYLASDPPVELNLSIARCQRGVVITTEANSLWWTISTIYEVLGTTPVQYFAYQGPHGTQKACNDALADVRSRQGSRPSTREVSTTCGPATVTY